MSNDFGSASLSAGSQSSGQSQAGKNAQQSHAAAQYRDDANLKTALKYLTTLEEKEDTGQIGGGGPSLMGDESIANKFHQKKEGKKNMFRRWEKYLLSRLFQINHVVLKNHSVSVMAYHLIMLFEFLQILFFVFYRIEFTNEYGQPLTSQLSTDTTSNLLNLNMNSAASTMLNNTLSFSNLTSQNISGESFTAPTFRVDFYFTFINFQMYTLENVTVETFTMIYSVFTGLFYLFLLVLFVLSSQAFEDSKTEDIKESSKIVLKILTFIMSLFLFLFQIPLITILLQGYLCNEDPNVDYTIQGMGCNSITHIFLTVLSSLTIIVYCLFLFLQQNLYTSNNFESVLPWSGIERKIVMLKVVYKLVLSSCFIFDKSGSNRALIGLISAILCGILAYKRYYSALIFRRSVFNATLFYEVITGWLQIMMAIRNFLNSEINITSLTFIVLAGIFLSLTIVILRDSVRVSYIETLHPSKFEHPHDYELYFYYMYQIIESEKPSDKSLVQGMIFNHVHYCEETKCPCSKIVSQLDRYQAYLKMKIVLKQIDEEEDLHGSFNGLESKPAIIIEQPAIDFENAKPIEKNEALQSSLSNLLSAKIPMNDFKRQITNASSISHKSEGGLSVKSLLSGDNGGGMARMNSRRLFLKAVSKQATSKNGGVSKFLRQQSGNQQSRIGGIAKSIIEMTKFFKDEDSEEVADQDNKKILKKHYKFFSILIKEAINKFPKNVDLKVINAFVFKNKLMNEFKAVFELMTCELCGPTLHDKFTIFRRKIEVEQILMKQHFKTVQRIGQLDIIQIYNYEKCFMRYQLYEYITVYAAQSFWRELMQKHINASILQEKGQEISKNYEMIVDIAKNLMKIYPSEIKFLYRFGTFLLHIINNEFDALQHFETAYNVFQSKISKRTTTNTINQQTIFGENSAAAIIVMSATSTKVGIIIHANDEIENVLGFNRRDVIGKNISLIMPRPIARVHDQFIHRYFDTARQTVIDIQRQLLGKSKEGYLKQLDLIVKVYPHLTDKVIFVGFIQKADNFLSIDAVKQEYSGLEQHYIITDDIGNITNVTESLNQELGLNAKFFNYTESIFQQMISIEKICEDILDPDQIELMELEGAKLTLDTRAILSSIDLEQLAAEEILEVKSSLNSVQAYVQMKRLVLDPRFCTLVIYRVVFIPKNMMMNMRQTMGTNLAINQHDSFNMGNNNSLMLGSEESLAQGSAASNPQQHVAGNPLFQNSGGNNASVAGSTFSSKSSNSQNFNSIIKDFKKALSERKTPDNLVLLNRIIITVLLATIILSSVSYSLEKNELSNMGSESLHLLMNRCRDILLVQLVSNIRSFVNFANGIEFQTYEIGSLQSLNRFDYLNRLIQIQASQLQDVHQFLSGQRESSDGSSNLAQNQFEYMDIPLFRLDSSNTINIYDQPFRIAMSTFLNQILTMNITQGTISEIYLMQQLLKSSPSNLDQTVYNQTTMQQKTVFFLLANGMRSLRVKSEQAIQFQLEDGGLHFNWKPFMALMLLGVFISAISTAIILQQVWIIERNKAEILSLYALLNMHEISKVYSRCQQYMDNLNESRTVGSKHDEPDQSLQGQNNQNAVALQTNIRASEVIVDTRILKIRQSSDQFDHDDISEEQREHLYLKEYKHQKNIQKQNDLNQQYKLNNELGLNKGNYFTGSDVYACLIKRTLEELREVNEKEDELKRVLRDQLLEKKKQQNANAWNEYQGDDAEHTKEREREEKKITAKQKGKKDDQFNIKGDDLDEVSSKKDKQKGKGFQKGENPNNNESFSSNESSQAEINHHKKNKNKGLNAEEEDLENKTNSVDMTQQELEERKLIFFRTIKTKNWGSILINSLVGILFAAYFIQMYSVQTYFQSQLKTMQDKVPLFFDRYQDLMLSFAFLRERIINNDTLSSYDPESKFFSYGSNLDTLYNDQSQDIENQITLLKNTYPKIVEPLVQLTQESDSTQFCSQVIGNLNMYNSGQFQVQHVPTSILSDPTKVATYQLLQITIIQALEYAQVGNTAALNYLYMQGADLNQGDYDRKTPMHIAARYNQSDTVDFLVKLKIKVNPLDRWGSTPLNYAQVNSTVAKHLRGFGAQLGTTLSMLQFLQNQNLTQNVYKLLFAAQRDDWQTIDALWSTGVNINSQDTEGRTPLMIAACERNLRTVQQIIGLQAELTLKDIRGNDALLDAKREQRSEVVNYIQTVMSDSIILQVCNSFGQGILSNGIQFAIGNFHKRFSDLFIEINQPTVNLAQRMSTLTQQSPSGLSPPTIQLFFSTQELYFHRIIDTFIDVTKETFSSSTSSYSSIVLTIFLIFIAIQALILLLLRNRLIEALKQDVFQSRGILNLIPDDFFEKNRTLVEKLIKNLKN